MICFKTSIVVDPRLRTRRSFDDEPGRRRSSRVAGKTGESDRVGRSDETRQKEFTPLSRHCYKQNSAKPLMTTPRTCFERANCIPLLVVALVLSLNASHVMCWDTHKPLWDLPRINCLAALEEEETACLARIRENTATINQSAERTGQSKSKAWSDTKSRSNGESGGGHTERESTLKYLKPGDLAP